MQVLSPTCTQGWTLAIPVSRVQRYDLTSPIVDFSQVLTLATTLSCDCASPPAKSVTKISAHAPTPDLFMSPRPLPKLPIKVKAHRTGVCWSTSNALHISVGWTMAGDATIGL